MPSPGQYLVDADGRRWWFDSGSTAIDLVYTARVRETLHEPSDLAAWLEPRFPGAEHDVTERDLVDALELRTSLARAIVALSRGTSIDPGDVDGINLYAALPDIPPVLEGGTRQAGRTRPRAAQALSSLAREAVTLISTAPERIRRCAAADCDIVFYDESRSNNRRWCAMERCGNRAKVRAFRERQAAAGSPTSR